MATYNTMWKPLNSECFLTQSSKELGNVLLHITTLFHGVGLDLLRKTRTGSS